MVITHDRVGFHFCLLSFSLKVCFKNCEETIKSIPGRDSLLNARCIADLISTASPAQSVVHGLVWPCHRTRRPLGRRNGSRAPPREYRCSCLCPASCSLPTRCLRDPLLCRSASAGLRRRSRRAAKSVDLYE